MKADNGVLSYCELSFSPSDVLLLRQFYLDLYMPEFPDPDERESLQNMERYLDLKARSWYGKNNYHILFVLEHERPIAGSISDFFAEANAGVIEFLVVAPAWRNKGIGARLLTWTEDKIAADAQEYLHQGPHCIVAEMNDPFKKGKVQDNFDSFTRALMWHKWGYKKLDFPYVQPALSHGQSSVSHLLFIGKILNLQYASGLPATVVKNIVHEYLRWAMHIEDPESCAEYRAMHRYLDGLDTVRVIPLGSYVGRDETKPLLIHEIANAEDPDLNAALSVYSNAFKTGPTAIASEEFWLALRAGWQHRSLFAYHLWALRYSTASPVEGMASFFTFPGAGYGGYVALSGSMHGTGYLRLLLARMEERMLQDGKDACGWYIECEPDGREAIFARMGFREVAITYRQPPLPHGLQYGLEDAPVLHLMYKEFGRVYYEPMVPTVEFLAALEWIYRVIYRIDSPQESSFFEGVVRQLTEWIDGMLGFR